MILCGEGSSPLARGLQMSTPQVIARRRIIPARAGFTTRVTARIQFGPGSSPLARGLPQRGAGRRRRRRIIPARAGFTPSPRPAGTPSADHPRSRGVYPAVVTTQPAPAGSSPLARGLLASLHGEFTNRGIIPARAGFTTLALCSYHRARDHPRSRGVYGFVFCSYVCSAGSSPLARGLRADL